MKYTNIATNLDVVSFGAGPQHTDLKIPAIHLALLMACEALGVKPRHTVIDTRSPNSQIKGIITARQVLGNLSNLDWIYASDIPPMAGREGTTGIPGLLAQLNPGLVLVYGDIPGTLAIEMKTAEWMVGSRVQGFRRPYLKAKIEAGLRSGSEHNDWEELVRKLADQACEIHTTHLESAARRVLQGSGIEGPGSFQTRGVHLGINPVTAMLETHYHQRQIPDIEKLDLSKPYGVMLVHREETLQNTTAELLATYGAEYLRNVDPSIVDNLASNQPALLDIFRAGETLARETRIVVIGYDSTMTALQRYGFDVAKAKANSKMLFIPRLPYFEYLGLISNASFGMSDGTMVDDLLALGIPTISLKEWPHREEHLSPIARWGGRSTDRIVKSYEQLKPVIAQRKPGTDPRFDKASLNKRLLDLGTFLVIQALVYRYNREQRNAIVRPPIEWLLPKFDPTISGLEQLAQYAQPFSGFVDSNTALGEVPWDELGNFGW